MLMFFGCFLVVVFVVMVEVDGGIVLDMGVFL